MSLHIYAIVAFAVLALLEALSSLNALVTDLVDARPMAPIQMKGISRQVIPYAIDGLSSELTSRVGVITEHTEGLDLVLDIDALDRTGMERAKRCLADALRACLRRIPLAGLA